MQTEEVRIYTVEAHSHLEDDIEDLVLEAIADIQDGLRVNVEEICQIDSEGEDESMYEVIIMGIPLGGGSSIEAAVAQISELDFIREEDLEDEEMEDDDEEDWNEDQPDERSAWERMEDEQIESGNVPWEDDDDGGNGDLQLV